MGQIKSSIIGLTGRLITAYDSTKIIQSDRSGVEVNFKKVDNFFYTDRGLRGGPGMTPINSTALSKPNIENVFQFSKTQPDESHVLVQAFDSNEDNSVVYKNSVVIPNTGDFDITVIHTDSRSSGSITAFASNGSRVTVTSSDHNLQNGENIVISGTTSYNGIFIIESVTVNTFDIVSTWVADDATGTWATRRQGRFSNAPLSHMCYCNGDETMIWGGDDSKVAGFILYDADVGAFTKDYTEKVKNTRTDSANIAILTKDSGATPTVSLYVGSILPIESIIFRMVTVNTTADTLSVDYWTGTAWSAVSNLSDGTASGGVPLAQTGTISFDSTETTAKTSIVEGVLGFWYRVQIPNCDNDTSISRVSLGIPVQPIQDLWDQVPRQFARAFYKDASSNHQDITINVSKDSFFYDTSTGGDTSTYFQMNGLASPDLLFGTFERIQGIQFKIIPGQENAVANTTMTVSYWAGSGWTGLSITDDTMVGGISFAQSGFVKWNAPGENVEFKKSIVGGEAMYFWKVSFDKTFSAADHGLYYVSYIPVQKTIEGYKFPLYAKNRLMLFSEQTGEKNKMIVSSRNTVNVFNGKDSGDPIYFGKDDVDIEAAVEIFARFTATLQSVIIVCQRNSTHILFGDDPDDWTTPPMPISSTIGCSAPLTMKASPIGFEFTPLRTKQVAIWMHSNGVYMYDIEQGLNVISTDIADLFDQNSDITTPINLDAISRASAVWNIFNGEYYYHLMLPTGTSTTNNVEMVFDIRRQKWSRIKRTPSGDTNKDLQAGAEIIGPSGANYTYAVEDGGYLQRLNNGTDYDGNNIEAEFQIGDIAFEGGNTFAITKVRHVQMPQVAKNTTSNQITCTHFPDGKTTGATFTLSPAKTGRRIAIPSESHGVNLDSAVFHSLSAKLITNDEKVPFEPLYLSTKYEVVREDKGQVS